MKMPKTVKVERQAQQALLDLLEKIPGVSFNLVEPREYNGFLPDAVVDVHHAGKRWKLWAEIKSNGQPRIVHEAIFQLKRMLAGEKGANVPILIAPYLSEQAREICKAERVCYLDLQGNAQIEFGAVYIERQVAGRPDPERRALRSLFKPKSVRILRTLLRDPFEPRRVIELAERANVSAGLVSTVGGALREHGWAEQTAQGLVLTDPNGLLDAWADAYEAPPGEELRFYTHVHGKALRERWRQLDEHSGKIALASYSAADWLAPYVRNSSTFLYADQPGLETLHAILPLESSSKGANIIVRLLHEDGALDDAFPTSDGIKVTSPVQTYLDLMHAGERGAEGAEHLREKLLEWPDER